MPIEKDMPFDCGMVTIGDYWDEKESIPNVDYDLKIILEENRERLTVTHIIGSFLYTKQKDIWKHLQKKYGFRRSQWVTAKDGDKIALFYLQIPCLKVRSKVSNKLKAAGF